MNTNGAYASLSIHASGSIGISKASSLENQTVFPEAQNVLITEYYLMSNMENASVHSLSIANCLEWTQEQMCLAWGADEAVSIVRLRYDEDGVEMERTSTFVNGVARFDDLTIISRVNAINLVQIWVDTNPVQPSGATSGDQFSATLVPESFSALGVISREPLLLIPVGDIAGAVFTIE